ncbi:MAG: sulfonate ABC transporter substrate-binding protein, partial [Granulosicoccus sp.]
YLHGVVVREDFATEYPEVVTAFIKAVYEAGEWIRADPMRAVSEMEGWTGVEKEVLYLYFSEGGHLTLDPTIKQPWIEALEFNHSVLAREKAIPKLDFDAWITEDFVKSAYAELGVDYEAEKAMTVDPVEANMGLPNEIWHARDGVTTYDDMPSFLTAMAEMQGTGAKLNATYVYDIETGLKLFGKTAFWVKTDESYATFLRKGEAEAYASENGGELIDFDSAISAYVKEG